MKPTSMPQNEIKTGEGLGDVLYSIFCLEFESRGVNYFNWLSLFPDITGGVLATDTPHMLVRRLASNPSVTAIMLSQKPERAITDMLFSNDNDIQVQHVVDFLDEITLNCRLRDPDLFDRNEEIFLRHLDKIIKASTDMDEEEISDYQHAMKRYGYLLLTLHYLRKIGCNHVFKERNRQA